MLLLYSTSLLAAFLLFFWHNEIALFAHLSHGPQVLHRWSHRRCLLAAFMIFFWHMLLLLTLLLLRRLLLLLLTLPQVSLPLSSSSSSSSLTLLLLLPPAAAAAVHLHIADVRVFVLYACACKRRACSKTIIAWRARFYCFCFFVNFPAKPRGLGGMGACTTAGGGGGGAAGGGGGGAAAGAATHA